MAKAPNRDRSHGPPHDTEALSRLTAPITAAARLATNRRFRRRVGGALELVSTGTHTSAKAAPSIITAAETGPPSSIPFVRVGSLSQIKGVAERPITAKLPHITAVMRSGLLDRKRLLRILPHSQLPGTGGPTIGRMSSACPGRLNVGIRSDWCCRSADGQSVAACGRSLSSIPDYR